MTVLAVTTLAGLALASLFVGTAAITLALTPSVPVQWLYVHFRVRKPVVWGLLLLNGGLGAWFVTTQGLPAWVAGVFAGLSLLGVGLAYRMHQSVVFDAVDFPPMADDPLALPLSDERECALVEVGGVSRAYPLDWLIHHHVVNDRFGDTLVALTYCAMCRTVIAFDVTELGPLFVGSFKQANLIVADRRTGTFFQQATFESVVGPLHPRTLEMIGCAMLPWGDVKQLDPMPEVVAITERDLRAFELPIPGVWRRIVTSEATPGLVFPTDPQMPARTRVIGVTDPAVPPEVYRKEDVLARGTVRSERGDFVLVGVRGAVNAYRTPGHDLELSSDTRTLRDPGSDRAWDLRGRSRTGGDDLERVAVSDEYWFSWHHFHPNAPLVECVGGA